MMNRKTWTNIIVWVSLYIFFFSMKNHFQDASHSLWSAAIDTVSLILVVLFTTQYLFPKYFTQGREYLTISLLFIVLYAGILFAVDVFLVDPFKDNIDDRPPMIFGFIRIFMGVLFTFFVSTSVKLIEHTNRLKENEKLLTEEKLETELKLLKAQINPHFIFNALNNIYSLTYMQSKNAPDSVLKLSEMLRYVFYDCNKDRVPVSSEVKYIENFNTFQQMKSEYVQNITLQTNLGSESIEIAPMLFIPFIENAFKYSRIEENEDAYVSISIENNGKLNFIIENSIPLENKPMAGSGTGIKNVQHRLSIIYPEKHVLNIKEEDNKYRVELSIEA